uniref:Uncharacterized protein n=1 Tax=Aegilops tauschii TaxID=37682 RepID=M8C7A7_AEGTA
MAPCACCCCLAPCIHHCCEHNIRKPCCLRLQPVHFLLLDTDAFVDSPSTQTGKYQVPRQPRRLDTPSSSEINRCLVPLHDRSPSSTTPHKFLLERVRLRSSPSTTTSGALGYVKFNYRRKNETGKSEDPKYHDNLEGTQMRQVHLRNVYNYR